MLVLEITTYALALWLGLYLIGRDPAKPQLRYAGLGLVAQKINNGLRCSDEQQSAKAEMTLSSRSEKRIRFDWAGWSKVCVAMEIAPFLN